MDSFNDKTSTIVALYLKNIDLISAWASISSWLLTNQRSAAYLGNHGKSPFRCYDTTVNRHSNRQYFCKYWFITKLEYWPVYIQDEIKHCGFLNTLLKAYNVQNKNNHYLVKKKKEVLHTLYTKTRKITNDILKCDLKYKWKCFIQQSLHYPLFPVYI